MPSRAPRRERKLGFALCLIAAVAVLSANPAAAADRPRVASINVCTDQLLLSFADPEQIIGLSPYGRDAARSFSALDASRFPRLSGEAEDVLVAKPDVVVAGRFTKRATRELLKEHGLRVEEFDTARSLDDAKAQMLRMGALVGHSERAQAAAAELDRAVARAKAAASRHALRVLPLSRRGWVSGRAGLMGSLLEVAGLSHAGAAAGGGFLSLEAIVSLRPDFLLLGDTRDEAEDQGRAFLLHPALQRLYPPERRLVIPEQLTVCGGPMLGEALDRLTAEIARVSDPRASR